MRSKPRRCWRTLAWMLWWRSSAATSSFGISAWGGCRIVPRGLSTTRGSAHPPRRLSRGSFGARTTQKASWTSASSSTRPTSGPCWQRWPREASQPRSPPATEASSRRSMRSRSSSSRWRGGRQRSSRPLRPRPWTTGSSTSAWRTFRRSPTPSTAPGRGERRSRRRSNPSRSASSTSRSSATPRTCRSTFPCTPARRTWATCPSTWPRSSSSSPRTTSPPWRWPTTKW
mmetsp:Transcript_15032/g.50893  ORF Transcript_15032/g.50893 Transcript_15032/m.50893 type:complete len:229 (+) Transcript_15032:85-771(+)